MRVVRYALAVVVIAIAPQAARAAQPDAKAQAVAALHDAQSFLGTGPNADGWKNYLGLAALDRELQRTGPVDIPAVTAVLAKLNSGAKGLDLPALVKLRKSVAAWVDELNLPGPEALGDAVNDAASQFHPIGSLDIEQARTELQKKAAELNAFFAPQGANGAAWQKYLLLSDLQVQAKPAVDADRDLLAKIAARFDADKPGLELSQVRATATALAAYRELVAAAATEGLNTQYEAEIKSLGEWLAKYVQTPGEENAAEVNQRLAWLRRMHQAGGLVRAIRRAFDRPNVYVAAKSNIVGAGIERSIDDVSPLVDNINGTQINGTGHTVGQLKVELVPNSDRAVLDIMLVGTTYSNTVGQNGPATIYSQGTTQIGGRKRVLIDALGIRDLPATAAAVTKTRVTGVAAGRPGGLINNIAQQKVAEGKGQAELVASDHAAARVRTRLNKEAANDLGRAARDFQEKFRNPLIRQHLYPSVFDFSTTRDLLHVTMLEADDSQLGAPARRRRWTNRPTIWPYGSTNRPQTTWPRRSWPASRSTTRTCARKSSRCAVRFPNSSRTRTIRNPGRSRSRSSAR